MSYEMFSATKSLLFIGTFLIAVLILIPKSVNCWNLWKETRKTVHLSGAVSTAVIAFFFLAADFLFFMITVARGLNE
jgi:hypothetical protein